MSAQMLIRLTQIDYDREVALVALTPSALEDRIIGMARIIFLADGSTGEFAVVLGDSWQGKGVGAILLRPCLAFAKTYGLKKVYGLVLRENRQMLSLGKKLGFNIKREPGYSDIEIEIDMETLDLSQGGCDEDNLQTRRRHDEDASDNFGGNTGIDGVRDGILGPGLY